MRPSGKASRLDMVGPSGVSSSIRPGLDPDQKAGVLVFHHHDELPIAEHAGLADLEPALGSLHDIAPSAPLQGKEYAHPKHGQDRAVSGEHDKSRATGGRWGPVRFARHRGTRLRGPGIENLGLGIRRLRDERPGDDRGNQN